MDTMLSRRSLGWQPVTLKPGNDPQTPPAGIAVVCGWCDLPIAGAGEAQVIGICPRCLHRELTKVAAVIVLLFTLFAPSTFANTDIDMPKPKPPAKERFYTPLAKIELAAAVTLAAADSANTCNSRGRELTLPSQNCGVDTGILMGQVAAQEFVAYEFYKHGHRKLAYMVRLVTIQANVRGLAQSKANHAF